MPHSARLAPTRTAALDRIVDAGFLILLVVCGLRYFAFHPLAGGELVLLLAIGAGASYLAAVLVAIRPGPPSTTASSWHRAGLLTATGLWLPLTVLAPSFGWCAFALIFAMYRVLPVRGAVAASALIVLAVSVGLWIMSGGTDLGLVLGPFFGGIVLSYAFATLTRTLAAHRTVITELTDTREQLAESERAAGALAERNRVASELHDTVVQRTASALLLLETAQHRDDPAAARAIAAEAGEAMRETLTDTRRLVHGLADPHTAGVSLERALRAEASAAGAAFTLEGAARAVPDDTVHALQRITREALVNAAKHAAAATTRVTVTFFPDSLRVDISDNGIGFAPAGPNPAPGFGIRAMTWRAQNLGGTLTIESHPGHGSVVAASIPLAPAGDAVALPADGTARGTPEGATGRATIEGSTE
ncbi:sensor histidine kinase [Leucobacter chromiireducens]|uniref:histidine kinase n=1 Tax=Leucobacter chromiireducens subsp. solipictus TaxID=398235 RepID=A0ABS1SLD1_9MICO|nr:histidine kinase [Leucobacter chromiireducens]MBL3680294.1 sensor histidine kinase [Leucobacter chromiireducens subsp. solipictus]